MADWLSKFRKIQSDAPGVVGRKSIFRRRGEPSRFYKFVHFWSWWEGVSRATAKPDRPFRFSLYTTLLALIPMLLPGHERHDHLPLKKEGKEQIERVIEKICF